MGGTGSPSSTLQSHAGYSDANRKNLVDDFFGVSAAKRRRSGSDIMDKTADLVGIRMDPGKSLDSECLMPLLSAEVQTEEANLADDFFEVPAAKR